MRQQGQWQAQQQHDQKDDRATGADFNGEKQRSRPNRRAIQAQRPDLVLPAPVVARCDVASGD